MPNVIEIVVKAKDEAEKVIKGVEKTSQDFGKTMTKVGLASGLALAGVAVESVKLATTYEAATTRLVTSAGETQAGLATVSKGMLGMADSTATGANELAKGMYTVESAGFHAADGLTVLKAAAQGAKAEGAELGTVANAVTDVLVDYHLKASDAANVTSQMITAVSHGKTSFEDFSGSMHNILPLAAAMHLSFADVVGVLAEMTAHGMSADQASQNIANTMRSLASPTATMTNEFKAVGTSVDEVQHILGTQGLAATLQFLTEKAKAFTPNLTEQEGAMRKLIGTAPGLSVMLMTAGENYKDTTATIKDVTGATADATGAVKGYAEYQKTLKGQVDQMTASFEDLGIKIGQKLVPAVKDVVGWMDKNHTAVVDGLKVLGALATLAAGYTLTTKAVALGTAAWTGAQKLLTVAEGETATATAALGAAMDALPLVAVVAGLAAMSTGMGSVAAPAAYKAGDAVAGLTKQIQGAASGSADAVQQLLHNLDMMAADSRSLGHVDQPFKDLDATLAQMVSNGHAKDAQTTVGLVTTELLKQGLSLGYINDQVLPKYNAAVGEQAKQAQGAAGATGDLSDAVNGLTDAQGNATDAVSQATSGYDAAKKAATGYLDSITALYGKFGNLSDAQAAFTLAMDDGAASILKGRDAVDLNTKAGATNFQTFERMAKAAEDVSGKMVEQGSTTADATRALRNNAKQIDDLAAKSGLTKGQIQQLNKELFGVPDVKKITIETNADVVSMRLDALAGQIAGISGAVGQIGKGGNAAMFRATGGEVGAAATGGDRSGLVWVGEQGPELVRLPTGSTVRSNPDSMAALAGASAALPPIRLEWHGPGDSELFAMLKRWIRVTYGTGPDAVSRAFNQSY